MSLEININNAIKEAMKNKDQQSLTPLRAIKTALLMQKTQRGSDQTISNEDEMKILQKLVKQRRESAEIYRKQGRDDLADPEIKEAELIQNFLPKALSEKEIETEVKQIIDQINAGGMKDMGKVMGIATKNMLGKADGKIISTVVRKAFIMNFGSVVQLDRISDFGSEGWGFESSLGHKITLLIFICFFSISHSQSIIEKVKLSKIISETSGIEYHNDLLVTHNDSGNDPSLYYLDYSGKIIHTRKFDGINNNDWEDLTADENFIYIADMGNNFDTRENLMVIKVSKDIYDKNYEIIQFYYPEQTDFKFKLKSQFDAEAIIADGEFLLIFTKNRAKKITDIYKIPKKAGSYAAKKIGSLNTNSIVTGGDYLKDLNLLVLTSTVEFDNYFLLKIDNFDLKSENNQIEIYEIPVGKTQVEAVKIIDSHNFWLSSENEKNGYPYLYKFSLKD